MQFTLKDAPDSEDDFIYRKGYLIKIYDRMIDFEFSKIRTSKFPDIARLLHTPISGLQLRLQLRLGANFSSSRIALLLEAPGADGHLDKRLRC
jgi:hypothetical protein